MSQPLAVFLAAVLLLAVAPGCAKDADQGGADGGQCGDPYPAQASSPYVLPWEPGKSFTVGQGSCTKGSHTVGTADAFALDVDMPIGTTLVAARAGTVLSIEGKYTDSTRKSGEENFVNVQHEDGSVAVYFHLTTGGPLVAVGERVNQGQAIARSGDTGESTEPHLHFQVDACKGCGSIPVTFRNTRGHPHGLVEGEAYLAE